MTTKKQPTATPAKETPTDKMIQGMKRTNKVLRNKVGASVTITYDHKENARKLREMLVIVEVLRKLDSEEFATNLDSSVKDKQGITFEIVDVKTKKKVITVKAYGSDNYDKYADDARARSWYDFIPNRVVLDTGSAEVAVPKFLLEDFASTITSHISNWSDAQSLATAEKLDAVLEKIGN